MALTRMLSFLTSILNQQIGDWDTLHAMMVQLRISGGGRNMGLGPASLIWIGDRQRVQLLDRTSAPSLPSRW